MSDQCPSYTHSLILSVDGNRSQDENIDIRLERQSAEEYGADHLFPVNSHKPKQIPTASAGHQLLRQVADQRSFLLAFGPREHRNKQAPYG